MEACSTKYKATWGNRCSSLIKDDAPILSRLQEDKLLKVRSIRLSGRTTISQISELAADEDIKEEDNNDSSFTVGEEMARRCERGYCNAQLWEWKKQQGENYGKWGLYLESS